MNTLLLPPVIGVVGMLAALFVYMLVMKYPDGEDKVKKNRRSDSCWSACFYEN